MIEREVGDGLEHIGIAERGRGRGQALQNLRGF
jgi:hypothetical protein